MNITSVKPFLNIEIPMQVSSNHDRDERNRIPNDELDANIPEIPHNRVPNNRRTHGSRNGPKSPRRRTIPETQSTDQTGNTHSLVSNYNNNNNIIDIVTSGEDIHELHKNGQDQDNNNNLKNDDLNNDEIDKMEKSSFKSRINLKILKNYAKNIVESPYTVILMCVLTIWSLFSDDIRVIAVPKSGDIVIKGITIATLFCFILEILLLSFSNKSYFRFPHMNEEMSVGDILNRILKMGSFYFLLDCFATLTLVIEVSELH
jgi:hypothetical protein